MDSEVKKMQEPPAWLVRDGNTADEDDEDGDDEMLTTDIGIYDEEVYDEYLGPLMGRLRRVLVRNLRWESPLLAKHQVRTRSLLNQGVLTLTRAAGNGTEP